jgi:uncharacterized membrane protein YeaQ/YmgE (transglycosylase-associated protein family)
LEQAGDRAVLHSGNAARRCGRGNAASGADSDAPSEGFAAMLFLVLLALVFIILLVFVLSIIHALFGLVLFLVIAGLCAAAAEYFLGHREGVGETLLIGLIGAALGVIGAYLLHLPRLSIAGVPIVWTILGSMAVVAILKLARGDSNSIRRL